jgi:hypothetical protein
MNVESIGFRIRERFLAFYDIFKKSFTEIPWLPAIFMAGAVLRISGFTVGSIWYDEMFSLQITHQGFGEMLRSLHRNISPPGWEILLWLLTRILGWNEFSLRVLSVISGIAALWMTAKISSALQFTRSQQIAGLAVVAFLPYQLIAAQQGRVYALFAFLYLLGIYGVIVRNWLLLGVSIGGMLWCHNISFLFIPGLIIAALYLQPNQWQKIFVSAGVAMLAFVPWIRISVTQAGYATPFFTPITIISFLYNFYAAFFAWGIFPWSMKLPVICWLVLTCFLPVIYSFIVWLARALLAITRFSQHEMKPAANDISVKGRQVLFIWFFCPFFLVLAASVVFRNVFIYRVIYLFSIPMILWLVQIYVSHKSNLFHKTVWALTIFVMTITLLYWSPTQIGGSAVEDLSSVLKKSHGDKDVFYHNTGLSFLVFDYYFPNHTNYLVDGTELLGYVDLQVVKTPAKQISPDELPLQADRVWLVWTRNEDLEIINQAADMKMKKFVEKHQCPLTTIIHYPQSWDVYVYLCDLQDSNE